MDIAAEAGVAADVEIKESLGHQYPFQFPIALPLALANREVANPYLERQATALLLGRTEVQEAPAVLEVSIEGALKDFKLKS